MGLKAVSQTSSCQIAELISDVHATSDGVVLMFHDPTLDRTTTGKGLIRKQPWKDVIE